MPIPIKLPSLSPTMEEGAVVRWRIAVGDSVKPGDVLAEIETDKAVMDLEAIDEGVLGAILVEAGSGPVKVNTDIAIISTAGEMLQVASLEPAQLEQRSSGYDAVLPDDANAVAPIGNKEPNRHGEAVARTALSTARQESTEANGKLRASPLARRLARQFKVDLRNIAGSGPRGRVTRGDVELAAQRGTAPLGSGGASVHDGAGAPGTPLSGYIDLFDDGDFEISALSSMRKTIARRMTAAARDIPHFPLTVDCHLDALIEQRLRLNERLAASGEQVKVSINDFVIRAAAYALMQVPEVNATYTDDGLMLHKTADIAIAVAMRDGLITPILRRAHEKGLRQISAEVKDIAARAKEKRLQPQEYVGGTFSISNMGMYGLKHFISIINPPHAAILSVGAITEQALSKNGRLYSGQVMSATLVCDHRAIDGLPAAEWIRVFKDALENPVSLLL